jgi:Integrase core domain
MNISKKINENHGHFNNFFAYEYSTLNGRHIKPHNHLCFGHGHDDALIMADILIAEFPPQVPLSLEEARHQITKYIRYYNDKRLHGAIGYIASNEKLECRDIEIFTKRDKKLEAAREVLQQKRQEI